MMHMKRITLNVWALFALVVIYAVISFFAILFTTGGWAALMELFAGGIFYVAFILIMLIISMIAAVQHRTRASFKLSAFIVTILLQIAALLFNVGDCGDAGGSYFFIQRIMGGTACGSAGYSGTNTYMMTAFFVLGLIYVVMLLVSLASIRLEQRPSSEGAAV